MDRRESSAEIQPHQYSLPCAEWTLLANYGAKRLAMEKLHPKPDPTLSLVGTIDRGYVRVAHSSEQTPLLDDCAPFLSTSGFFAQELESDFTVQLWIVCPENLTKRTLSYLLQ